METTFICLGFRIVSIVTKSNITSSFLIVVSVLLLQDKSPNEMIIVNVCSVVIQLVLILKFTKLIEISKYHLYNRLIGVICDKTKDFMLCRQNKAKSYWTILFYSGFIFTILFSRIITSSLFLAFLNSISFS